MSVMNSIPCYQATDSFVQKESARSIVSLIFVNEHSRIGAQHSMVCADAAMLHHIRVAIVAESEWWSLPESLCNPLGDDAMNPMGF